MATLIGRRQMQPGIRSLSRPLAPRRADSHRDTIGPGTSPLHDRRSTKRVRLGFRTHHGRQDNEKNYLDTLHLNKTNEMIV